MKLFKDLGLSEKVLYVLDKKGFETPTPIQQKIIPAILGGTKDVVGQAQTGTGKTAAFGLPIIELLKEKSNIPQALVLTPTRELAIQVSEEINSLKGNKKLSIVPIYGGQSIDIQLRSLRKGVDIVVGTPGRILDHIRRKVLNLNTISFLVLDEADEMLNMGFLEDVSEIMKKTPLVKRTMLFSATMPAEIMNIAKKYMREYDTFKTISGPLTVAQTDQIYFEVSAQNKFDALCRIIDVEEGFYGLVFCRTKVDVDEISKKLSERGYAADGLHGDMSQSQREKMLFKFKKRVINILVATDVAARGIDVQDLTHVINYALPQDPESYVHRIGRTGRAGKEGVAVTFITPTENRRLEFIRRKAKTDIRKEKLPKIKDIINVKKRRIKAKLYDILQMSPNEEYFYMAKELLSEANPTEVLAALLQYSFKGELEEKNYTEIPDSTVVDNRGKTRLFVREGKRDGLTPQKLMKLVTNNCNIQKDKVRDIQILDNFSFISLPFHEAEILLAYFKNKENGKAPLIAKAKIDKNRKKFRK